MAKKRNIIVGQSGGPTAVINSSLAGVYKNAIERGFDKVYGMLHGIQGLLDEQYIDLSTQIHSELDIELLKRTPSAFLGSCRYKLPEIHEDKAIYEKIFEILNKLDIYAFIYIGGNDSMDTIKELSDYAILTGQTQKFLGVPKTIDNDLALTDHTPGFGSAAKYIGASTKEVIRDALGLTYKKNMITIMEIMGRNAGWLTGATALAKSEDCDGPDLIYLPEVPFDVEKFLAKVKDLLNKKASIVIAVSEGIKLADGRYVCELGSVGDYVDAFGHKQLQGTATYLANFLAAECGCKTRAVELSTSEHLLEATLDMDEEAVEEGIEKIHTEYVSNIQYNNENSLSSVLAIAYLSSMEYYFKPVRELPTGRGFADFVFIPKPEYVSSYPALVVELKWNKNVKTALQQIKEKQYPDSVLDYTGDILLVEINYDKKTKEHQCLIEKYEKL